ncbi:hypothetical protein ACVIKO_000070 [Rhizobium ruizarguesonis]
MSFAALRSTDAVALAAGKPIFYRPNMSIVYAGLSVSWWNTGR